MPPKAYRREEHQEFIGWFLAPRNDNPNELRQSLGTVPSDSWGAVEGALLQAIGDARGESSPAHTHQPGTPIQAAPAGAEVFRQDDLLDHKEHLVQEESDRRRKAP
jgi:hypothetical protein